jgi:hypothetical protein
VITGPVNHADKRGGIDLDRLFSSTTSSDDDGNLFVTTSDDDDCAGGSLRAADLLLLPRVSSLVVDLSTNAW